MNSPPEALKPWGPRAAAPRGVFIQTFARMAKNLDL